MIKTKLRFLITLLALALLLLGSAVFASPVWGDESRQTIPTRTSVPPPTATPSSGGGGNNPTATNTPSAAEPTATSTLLPVNIAPTPVGGFLPTAVPCGSSPTIETLGATNVRRGPGLEYEVIGELVYLEVRYIVGRAETAEWWLIQFNNGELGWVANEIVIVQGYIPIVPIVEAPPLNGSTPTPGAVWNPTPFPFCTVTPPPTDTPTVAPTTASTEVAEESPTETPTPTVPPPTEVRPTDTPIAQPTAVPLDPTATLAATAVISDPPTEGGSNLGLLVLAVAAVLGIAGFIFFRRQRG